MNTRQQSQKASQNGQNQRKQSLEKIQIPDMSQLLIDKIENLSATLTQNFAKEMNNFKKEIKQEIRAELKEINQKVDTLIADNQKIKQRLGIVEYRVEKLETEYAKILGKKEEELDDKAIWELKWREKCIKIRGLPEEKNENLEGKLIKEIAKFLKRDPVFFEDEIDKIYRINSAIAKQKGLPRDIAIYFVRKRIRDAFLSLHNETPFTFQNQDLKILKDIPGRILKKRKEYTTLTTFLRKENIPYKWETPEGLTFWWKQKRNKIETPEQARAFLRKVVENSDQKNKGKEANIKKNKKEDRTNGAEKQQIASEESEINEEEKEEEENSDEVVEQISNLEIILDPELEEQDILEEEERIREGEETEEEV